MARIEPCLLGLFLFIATTACWTDGEFPEDTPLGCGAAICSDRLDIFLNNTDGVDFPAGEYDWELEFNQVSTEHLQCRLIAGKDYSCSGSEHLSTMHRVERDTFKLSLSFAPARFQLRLKFNDTWTYDQSVTPKYHMVTPNGPECEPICFQATKYVEINVQEDSKGSTP